MQKNIFDSISTDIVKVISKKNNEPSWMLEYRLKSFKKFQESSFEQSILFKKYNDFLTKLSLEDINFEANNQETETEHRGRYINFLQVNNKIVEKNIENSNDAILTDINEAISKYPDIVKSYIEKNPIRDKFEYLADAIFQTGLFVHIPKDVKMLDTIRYINRQENTNSGIFNKNLIILEDNSDFNLFIEHYSSIKSRNIDSIFGYSKDIFVANNAKLSITEMQLFDNNMISFMNKRAEIGKQSSVKLAVGYLGGKVSRSRSYSSLIGDNSTIQDLHLVIGAKEERHDLVTSVCHSAKGTKGSVDVKGVLTGKSQMTLKGMNKIEKHAHNADTFLGGHAILLGNKARANIIPGLEINNRNVQAKHSAAVAPIDEDLLFYMQSRSLDKNAAIKLIVTGFLESILKRMEVEAIKEQIAEMIKFKFDEISLTAIQDEQEEILAVKGEFKKLCKLSEIQNGEMKNMLIDGKNILLSNINNKIFATGGQCTHQEVNLEDGFIVGEDITCPLHLSKFNLKTGKSLNPPAIDELAVYNVKIQDEEIYIEID